MGAATNFVIIPAADVAIVALTNATPSGVPETLTAEFADLVEFGEVREDWRGLYAGAFAGLNTPIGDLAGKQPPANPSPARAASSYIGTYVNDYWGPVTVTADTGALTLSMGPKPVRYPMTHWDADVFTIDLTTENAPPGSVSKVSPKRSSVWKVRVRHWDRSISSGGAATCRGRAGAFRMISNLSGPAGRDAARS